MIVTLFNIVDYNVFCCFIAHLFLNLFDFHINYMYLYSLYLPILVYYVTYTYTRSCCYIIYNILR